MKRVAALLIILAFLIALIPANIESRAAEENPVLKTWKFDLGGNGAASGYIGVSAEDSYNKSKGYGILQTSLDKDLTIKGSTGALSDAIHFQGANGAFRVDLKPGVYRITVTTGDDVSTIIDANGVHQLLFMTGKNAVDTFTIPITAEEGCLKIHASRGMGSTSSISAIEIEQISTDTLTKPTIWLCGDSTVASYYNTKAGDKRGWGEYLHKYIDTATYNVRNVSISGIRTEKMYTDYFGVIEKYGKSGDILVLAHGINDYRDNTKTSYITNMTSMVRCGKAKGMKVYVVKENGDYPDCKKNPLPVKKYYSDELDQIAASEYVNVIDLYQAWLHYCLEQSLVIASTFYNEGVHPNEVGADRMAKLMAELLFPKEPSWPVTVDPYPDFDSTAKVIYKTEKSGEIITNPHKGYVMEVHNLDMFYSGKHHLGIDGSDGNKAWDVTRVASGSFHWEDLNPEENIYNWEPIDAALKACDHAGMTYAIRIIAYTTNIGSDDNYGEEHDFVPDWVYKKGAEKDTTTYKGKENSPTIKVPNWSDEIYNESYKKFITALAERYDNDPRVEYIENRAYGNMSEWHTSEFDNNPMPSVEIQKSMLDHFSSVFKNTTISVFAGARDVYDYADSLGFAKRYNGLVMGRNAEWTLAPSYRSNVPTMGDNHTTYESMLKVTESSDYTRWSVDRYRDSVEIPHLTFFAIDQDSGCGFEIYRDHKDLIDEMCNRLGYNFTVTSAKRNGNKLKVVIKNIGLAPAFFDIDLCAEITDADGKKLESFGEPIRIEKGSFRDGDERAYLFEYDGKLDEMATICLTMYDRSKKASKTREPIVRFDNKNNLSCYKLKLVAKEGSTPKPSATPQPSATTEPSTTPQPSATTEPSTTPQPSATTEPSTTPQPGTTSVPSATPQPGTTSEPSATPQPEKDDNALKIGDTIRSKTAEYTIISSSEVSYNRSLKILSTITIPEKVSANGRIYTVTKIKEKAFYKNTKLKKVIIGKNIKKIGARAFKGCKKLKSVKIKGTEVTFGKECFKGIYKKAVFKVPKSKVKTYRKKLLKKGKAPKKIKVKKK